MTKERPADIDSATQSGGAKFSRLTILGRHLKEAKGDKEAVFARELTAIFGTERYFRHQPISDHSINKIGGIVEHLVVAEDNGEIVSAAKIALKAGVPYIVVGALTGALFSEIGFSSLVIINRSHNITFDQAKSEVTADAGVGTAELANVTAGRGLSGLEFLAGIPGTLGGAIITGVELEGKNLDNFLKELVVFMPNEFGGEIIRLAANDSRINSNRGGFFARSENSPIILSLCLRLSQIDQPEILRRLAGFRYRHQITKMLGRTLGFYFCEPIGDSVLPLNEAKKVSLPKNVSINWKKPDYLYFRSDKGVQPTDLRKSIETIQEFSARHGKKVEIRMRFLGYWPNKEGNGSQTDAESLQF